LIGLSTEFNTGHSAEYEELDMNDKVTITVTHYYGNQS
jgi:hypothetical protein